MSGFAKAWQTRVGGVALERMGVPLMTRIANPFGQNRLEDIVWGTCCLHYNDQKKYTISGFIDSRCFNHSYRPLELKEIMAEITDKMVPLFIVIPDNNSVMNMQMKINLVKTFGSNFDHGHLYDKTGQLEQVAAGKERFELIRTRACGYISFIKYPFVVNQAVADLLEKVIKTEKFDIRRLDV